MESVHEGIGLREILKNFTREVRGGGEERREDVDRRSNLHFSKKGGDAETRAEQSSFIQVKEGGREGAPEGGLFTGRAETLSNYRLLNVSMVRRANPIRN
jgi:hypothetical protein